MQSIHPEKVCMYKQFYLRIIRNDINSKSSSFCFPFSIRNHDPLFFADIITSIWASSNKAELKVHVINEQQEQMDWENSQVSCKYQ